MALLHRADLHPTKLDLIAAWLPTRAWYRGPAAADVERVASYRFDDPAGDVGIETLLVSAGTGPLVQVPLSYRGAPLDGHDHWLVGTTEHSVLGRRWVYDACGDPVYAAVLTDTIFTGAGQAQEFVDVDGRLEHRASTTSVSGSGSTGHVPTADAVVRVDDDDPTLIVTDGVELTVARILDRPGGRPDPAGAGGQPTLAGTWQGQPTPVLLAHARVRRPE
jgi:hypothetical protein